MTHVIKDERANIHECQPLSLIKLKDRVVTVNTHLQIMLPQLIFTPLFLQIVKISVIFLCPALKLDLPSCRASCLCMCM